MVRLAGRALAGTAALVCAQVLAQQCVTPGDDGPATVAGTQIVNTYYAGSSGSVPAGSTTVTLGTQSGAATGFSAGDMALIIQMQGATYTTTNSITAYGDGASGAGITALNGVGRYEFARVTNVAGSVLSVTGASGGGLVNSYTNTGTSRYQVVRVPQYSSLTITGVLAPARWNGAAGGVVAVDVAGVLNFAGGSVNASGLGFRGGLGRALGGSNATTNADVCALSTVTAHGAKGEGIGGQSRDLLNPVAVAAETGLDNYACTGVAGGAQLARGAPGNAGGGGTDEHPSANDNNSGGGGGAGYADGGKGGNSYATNLPYGGYGGRGVIQSVNLLTMGGGGGAGSRNNSSGVMSSGGAGGGIVIIRAGSITGSGTINVSGLSGNLYVPDNDAGGGGGGGGSVLVLAAQNGGGTVTVNANGGDGSNSWPTQGGGIGNAHGPGGGGGGGYIAYSGGTVAVSGTANNGVHGTTTSGGFAYGASDGFVGTTNSGASFGQVPGVQTGSACLPILTISKQTVPAQPVTRNTGTTVLYRIIASNAAGRGDAFNVTLSDALPGAPAWQYQTPTTVTLAGGATRPSTTDPAANATTPSWSNFTIPGGGSVTLDFNVLIPSGNAAGTYQNPANVTYSDPTRTTAATTVTPGGTYAAGGTVPGSNYVAASSTQEDVQVLAAPTLSVNKSFSPDFDRTAPYNTTLTITITNPSTSTINGIAFTDTYPGTAANPLRNVTTGTSTACGGTLNATNPGTGSGSLALTGGTLAAGQSCTISVALLATGTVTTSFTYNNTVTVTGTGVNSGTATATFVVGPAAIGPLVVSKLINGASSAVIAAGGTATMVVTITNPNTVTSFNGVTLTDTFPTGMVGTVAGITSQSCNGLAGSNWSLNGARTVLTLASTTINPGNATCTVTLGITAAAAGVYTNTTGAATSTTPALTSNTATATLRVDSPPLVTKTFTPSSIGTGNSSTMVIRVTNPASNADNFTNAAITDTYAGGLTNVGAGTLACFNASGGAAASGTLTGGANGGTTVGMSGATIVPGGYCTITQVVTATANYTNTTGAPTAVAGGVTLTGTAASATLTVNPMTAPTISKAFSTSSVVPNGTATLTITLNNSNAAATGTMTVSSAFTDTLPTSNLGQAMTIASTSSLATTCAGAVTSTAVGVSPASVTLAAGSTIPAGGCTISVDVKVGSSVNSTYVNTIPAGALVTNAGNNAAAASATLYVPGPPSVAKSFTPSSIAPGGTSTLTLTLDSPIGGTVNNVNLTDRLPTGVSLAGTPALTNTCGGAVTLRNDTTPQRIELVGAVVTASGCTLTVNVTAAAVGVYDNNILNTDLTSSAGSPGAGTLATARLTVGGSSISGRLFTDNGSGGGTANDGLLGTGEGGANTGLANIRVRLTDCGTTTLATTITDGAGNYSLAGPASSQTVCVVADTRTTWIVTGANVNGTVIASGSTGATVGGVAYTYCRASGETCAATRPVNALRFAFVVNTSYSNLNFGQVADNTFVANGVKQAPANSSVTYAHVYTAGTAGTVTFAPAVTASTPASVTGWNEVLRLDSNCDGAIGSGETTIVTAASVFNVNAGDRVCLVLVEFTAPGAPDGAQRVVTITSNFTYTNSNPALPANVMALVDTTTVGVADGLTLRKEVCNSTVQTAAGAPCDPSLTGTTAGRGFSLSNTGSPNDVLIYRIIYTNANSKPSTNLIVSDTTPPYTVHAAAATCPAALTPTGLGTCTITQPAAIGQTGNYSWNFSGTLNGNASGVVLMTVSILPP
jgi:hypothetical protein